MRPLINDGLRALIAWSVHLVGALGHLLHLRAARRFGARQQALRRRLGVDAATPVRGWGPETEASVAAVAVAGSRLASTSGSTSRPKRLPYDAARLRAVKLAYVDAFARLFWARRVRRTSLYVFSALEPDDSLTTLMLDEAGLPSRLATLQAPYRLQRHPLLAELARTYGATALRLWLLTLANPGVLYATNPSTICAFFDDLERDWPAATALVRAPTTKALRRLVRRLTSRGAATRLATVAASRAPLPIDAWAPGVGHYVCWTGGWVQPFLDRLAPRLPGRQLVPMYSMSTETVETTPCTCAGEVAFLPLAPGVLYELLPADAPDEPGRLLLPAQAQPGERYTLVISHRWGLTRYQTDDVFECVGRVHGLPDLRFARRRALGYSFTGEKLTAEQLEAAYAAARAADPRLAGAFLTCVPSWPAADAAPHYRLLVLSEARPELEAVARACETSVCDQNAEYAAKLRSRRLAPMRAEAMALTAFARLVGGDTWQTQQKLLPLYRVRWEELLARPS